MKKRTLVIVGSGKLAKAIFTALSSFEEWSILWWEDWDQQSSVPVLVLHAGSGRQLEEVVAFCEKSRSTLLELSTGTDLLQRKMNFPRVICSNTAISIVKFLFMLSETGRLFKGSSISIEESHQASKKTAPGTAYEIADALGVSRDSISSLRDPTRQKAQLEIPEEFLGRHAFHRVKIVDGNSSITFETKVLGHQPYVDGILAIVRALEKNNLEPKKYEVIDFVRAGWI